MTTFAAWLKTQESRTDATGWLAGQWRDALHRPRVFTPTAIEKHLAEVHTGDETYIGQLASAVRIATDAYHHRDDPQPDQAGSLERDTADEPQLGSAYQQAAQLNDQAELAAAGLELAPGAHDAVLGDDSEPEFDGSTEPGDLLLALVNGQLILEKQLALQFALIKSIAATMGLNVDDDSLAAMAELWGTDVDSTAVIRAAADEVWGNTGGLAAQLAEPTPPQAFAVWWGQADHGTPDSPSTTG